MSTLCGFLGDGRNARFPLVFPSPRLQSEDGALTTFAVAGDLVSAVVSHHIRGPPKKSWGIEMTILTCIMRDVNQHSYLADIVSSPPPTHVSFLVAHP